MELWDSPLYSIEERLEMAKGGIAFRDKVIENLREQLKLQANAARAGMGAAKAGGAIMLELATQARAESSPDVLASERAMNAMLTEENEALERERDALRADADKLLCAARMAILALAHATEQNPMYRSAYETLDAAIYGARAKEQA